MTTQNILRIIPEKNIAPNNKVTELDIVIEIGTQEAKKTKELIEPKDLNLCVVIDRSGSMAGNKLETAKACCKNIVERLSSKDRFSLVTFDDECKTVVNPTTPRDEIERALNLIATGGSTDLANGWRQGALEVQSFATVSHINRIILLTDGEANKGETKASVLGEEAARQREEHSITTSAIGIGSSFNDDILAVIAFESGGRFYAVRDTQIEDIINLEFKGSLATQIERPGIKLQLPTGIEIIEQFHNLRQSVDRYRIRPILDNDVFNFALRLRISPEKVSEEHLTIECILYDGNGVVEKFEQKIRLTTEQEVNATEVNPIVAGVVEQYKIAKAENETIRIIEDHNSNLSHLSGTWDISTRDYDDATLHISETISSIGDTQTSLDILSLMYKDVEKREKKSKRRSVFLSLIRFLRKLREINARKPQRDIVRFTQRLIIALRQDEYTTLSRNEYNVDESLLKSYLYDTALQAISLLDTLVQNDVDTEELKQIKEELTNALAKLD